MIILFIDVFGVWYIFVFIFILLKDDGNDIINYVYIKRKKNIEE